MLWQYFIAIGASSLVVFLAAENIESYLFAARVDVEDSEIGKEESIMPFSYFFWHRLGEGALWIMLPSLAIGAIAFLVALIGSLDGTGQFF